ncbi:MAG: sulfatase-like hydrolase/transferase [Bryobacteraceae bacterium]
MSLSRFADIATLRGRWLVLGGVVVLPFFRFLMRNDYPLTRPESLAAAGVLALVCLASSALARRRMLFLTLSAAASVMMATVPVLRLIAPWADLSPRTAAAALALLLAAAVLLMRERFALILASFTLAAFAADIVQAVAARLGRSAPATLSAAAPPQGHVVYIVLDEHLATGAFPLSIESCRCAHDEIRKTFANAGFTHYTNAHSNYPSTVSSLSSLLNRRLLDRRRMFLDENSSEWRWGTRTFRENRLLSDFQRRGYRIEIFQHRAINHAAPGIRPAAVHEYWDRLGELAAAGGGAYTRFRWLVGNYQQSDLVLSQVKAFFPFRFAPHTTGPLASGDVWPDGVLHAVRTASKKTLFFVHLMAPHFPYLYRANGAVRDLEEWSGDRVDQRSAAATYEDRYIRYCEQAEFLTMQLRALFRGIESAGQFESATIAVHGDHGSRIRRVLDDAASGQPAGSDPERYDYAAKPDRRDLLDRFATLFAVKHPGRASGAVDARNASVLDLLNSHIPLRGAPPDSSPSVFLFDGDGHPREIPYPATGENE